MTRMHCAAVLTALGALMVCCSHAPQLHEGSESMRQSRMEYVQNNPGGKYNDYIMKGELAKGMGVPEVEASWGLPDKQRELDGTKLEQWIYADLDDVSGRLVVYSLAFTDRVLVYWEIHENLVTADGARPDLEKVPTFTPSDLDRMGGDAAPIKK